MKKLRAAPTEEHLWETVLIYQKVRFKTYSGLLFSYEIHHPAVAEPAENHLQGCSRNHHRQLRHHAVPRRQGKFDP